MKCNLFVSEISSALLAVQLLNKIGLQNKIFLVRFSQWIRFTNGCYNHSLAQRLCLQTPTVLPLHCFYFELDKQIRIPHEIPDSWVLGAEALQSEYNMLDSTMVAFVQLEKECCQLKDMESIQRNNNAYKGTSNSPQTRLSMVCVCEASSWEPFIPIPQRTQ